jgi:hypothetical protein
MATLSSISLRFISPFALVVPLSRVDLISHFLLLTVAVALFLSLILYWMLAVE